jgi:hypothetical protein
MQGLSSRVSPTFCRITWTKTEMHIIQTIYVQSKRNGYEDADHFNCSCLDWVQSIAEITTSKTAGIILDDS